MLETSVLFVPFGAQRIWFGIALLERQGVWTIWLSTFGNDVEALTGWRTRERAEVVLDGYLAAAAGGHEQLMSSIEASRHARDHVIPPAFMESERRQIVRSIASRAG